MALGSAQDEDRTNKIASWSDGFTMRAVFDVKKRKSVLKLIVALSLPLFVWLSASAQTTSAEKPSIKRTFSSALVFHPKSPPAKPPSHCPSKPRSAACHSVSQIQPSVDRTPRES